MRRVIRHETVQLSRPKVVFMVETVVLLHSDVHGTIVHSWEADVEQVPLLCRTNLRTYEGTACTGGAKGQSAAESVRYENSNATVAPFASPKRSRVAAACSMSERKQAIGGYLPCASKHEYGADRRTMNGKQLTCGETKERKLCKSIAASRGFE